MLAPTKRAPRPCAHPGCMDWVTKGSYCDRHYAEWQERRRQMRDEARKKYLADCDARRQSASRRGYNSAWNKARRSYLIKHPICVECGKPATEVDHIIPHKGDYSIFWNVENWQSLCHECHSRKTYREVTQARTKPQPREGVQPGDDMHIFYIK